MLKAKALKGGWFYFCVCLPGSTYFNYLNRKQVDWIKSPPYLLWWSRFFSGSLLLCCSRSLMNGALSRHCPISQLIPCSLSLYTHTRTHTDVFNITCHWGCWLFLVLISINCPLLRRHRLAHSADLEQCVEHLTASPCFPLTPIFISGVRHGPKLSLLIWCET